MIEERISDPETMPIVTSQIKSKRKNNNMKKLKIIYKSGGKVSKGARCIIGVTEEKEKGTEEKIKIIMIENFPK